MGDNANTSKTRILATSGIIMAMYVSVMYATQSFAFGAYQIRIATSIYSLSYFFPFLIVPLGLANLLGNFLGGLGSQDIIGGFFVGIITSSAIYSIRKFNLPAILVIPILIFCPGLIVPIWLSPLIGVPYPALALSLCIGQTLPAIVGYLIIKTVIRLKIDKLWNSKAL